MKEKGKPGYVKWQPDQFDYLQSMFEVLKKRTKKRLYLNRTLVEGMEKLVKEL